MDDLNSVVSKRIVAAREARGWNQFSLSVNSLIPQGVISRFETGRRLPNPRSLVRLADALGVSVDYLLGRTDN